MKTAAKTTNSNGSNGASSGAKSRSTGFTVPGMKPDDGAKVADALQERLVALIDLSLTLKHVHWNVVGPTFIGVHQMLDPQVAGVALMVDETAERIATLGTSPNGLAGNLVASRAWDDYSLARDLVSAHLGALDVVYAGLIESHRAAIGDLEELDPVTVDMLTKQAGELEQYHWFVRAHLESASGSLSTSGQSTEREAADAAARAAK